MGTCAQTRVHVNKSFLVREWFPKAVASAGQMLMGPAVANRGTVPRRVQCGAHWKTPSVHHRETFGTHGEQNHSLADFGHQDAALGLEQPLSKDLSSDFSLWPQFAQEDQQRDASDTFAQSLSLSQGAPGQNDFLERMVEDIAKQCSGESVCPLWPGMVPAVQNDGFGWDAAEQLAKPEVCAQGITDQRIEVLNNYIRQRAQEYIEGQAECSRLIAEVRAEKVRELEKARREREEVERQARHEISRLQQRLRDAGLEDSGDPSCEGEARPKGSRRSLGESQQQRYLATAEERIKQLEQYIKDQAGKYLVNGDAQSREKDEEILRLRQIILSSEMELRQANGGLQNLRLQAQQLESFWESGTRQLLATVDQFRGATNTSTDSGDGSFARTATKVSLTLSQTEGGDVNSLSCLLKDVLRSKNTTANSKAGCRAGEQEHTDASRGSDADSLPQKPGASHVDGRVVSQPEILSQLVNDMRQLLASGQKVAASGLSPPVEVPHAEPCMSGHVSPSPETEETDTQFLEGLVSTRKGIAESVIAVEKMLRTMERDLRGQCEELFGRAQLDTTMLPASTDGGDPEDVARLHAARDEARRLVPVDAELQQLGFSSLRCAQQRCSALLSEFVQLPQKLKAIFDLTKRLQTEISSRVPSSVLTQAEARATNARVSEQRLAFHVGLLQRRVQSLTLRLSASNSEGLAHCNTPEQEDHTRKLEEAIVDLHLSRYNDRSQYLALLQQSTTAHETSQAL